MFEPLVQRGAFTLASGQYSSWKIECDALTPEDWMTLAVMAVELYGRPSSAIGVPRGGLPFAEALQDHLKPNGKAWIVDDVFTTGGSLRRFRATQPADVDYHYVVAFTRNELPPAHRVVFWYGAPPR